MILFLTTCALVALPLQTPASTKQTYADRGYRGFGMIVAKAGDVNLDGVPDLIVGDNGMDEDKIPPAFWILSGKDGSVIRRIASPEFRSAYYRLDGGADLDGDKVPDVLIASHASYTSADEALFIVSGKTGEVRHHIPLRGVAAGNGDWSRVVGDFDHDGLADVAVLCPKTMGETRGALSIYSGKSGAPILDIKLDNEGGGDGGGFVEVGDIDADGMNDFVVLLKGSKGRFGSTRLYSSGKQNVLWGLSFVPSGEFAYASMALIGDADNDGVRDIAVGIYNRVDVLSVKAGKLIYRLEPHHGPGEVVPSNTDMGYGWALAAIGDIHQDGNIAFAMSETEDVAGVVRGFGGKSGNELWETPTRMEGDVTMFGYQLAALGDIDGDGVSDLAVGTWEGPMGDYGLARVISGKTGALLFEFRRKGDDVVVAKRTSAAEKPR